MARAGIPGFRLAVLCRPGAWRTSCTPPVPPSSPGPFSVPVPRPAAQGAATPRRARRPQAPDGVSRGGQEPPPGGRRRRRAGWRARSGAAAASAATLRHAVRTLRPSVVHSHLAYADLVCAAVLRGLRVPGVRDAHASGGVPLLVSTSADRGRPRATATRVLVVPARWPPCTRAGCGARTRRSPCPRHRRGDVTALGRPRRRRGSDGIARREPTAAPRRAPDAPRVLSLSRLARRRTWTPLLDSLALLRTTTPGARLALGRGGGGAQPAPGTRGNASVSRTAWPCPGHVDSARPSPAPTWWSSSSRWETAPTPCSAPRRKRLGWWPPSVGGEHGRSCRRGASYHGGSSVPRPWPA
ncbi:hypothetical protein QJS66_07610 [Kocuria rhizophila]|nr:hypothetical protein QJS66_07610 [Kocuria rhizophila]